jgi:hypothetical protein
MGGGDHVIMAKATKSKTSKSTGKKAVSKPAGKALKTSKAVKGTKKAAAGRATSSKGSSQRERKTNMKPTPKATSKTTSAKAAAPKAESAKPIAAKSAAKSAPAKKATTTAKKGSLASAAASSLPSIDTGLAAQNAAAMLVNRPASDDTQANQGEAGGQAKESAAFKNLKDQIAKPKPASLSNLFGSPLDQKKSGGHFNLNQQKGHNQTFGGMNKTGVPRRTNG